MKQLSKQVQIRRKKARGDAFVRSRRVDQDLFEGARKRGGGGDGEGRSGRRESSGREGEEGLDGAERQKDPQLRPFSRAGRPSRERLPQRLPRLPPLSSVFESGLYLPGAHAGKRQQSASFFHSFFLCILFSLACFLSLSCQSFSFHVLSFRFAFFSFLNLLIPFSFWRWIYSQSHSLLLNIISIFFNFLPFSFLFFFSSVYLSLSFFGRRRKTPPSSSGWTFGE